MSFNTRAGARTRAREAKASNSACFGAVIPAGGWHSARKNGHFDRFRGRSACRCRRNRSPAPLEMAVFADSVYRCRCGTGKEVDGISDGEGGSPGSQGRNWSANIAGLSVSSARYRQRALPQIMPLDSEPGEKWIYQPRHTQQ